MAELYAVNIKNSSGGDIVIEDLGITIADGTTFTMDEQYDYAEIFNSKDLRAFVAAGTLVVNNDIGDLSVANGLSWIKPLNEYEAGTNFYTRTQLQTSGDSNVHWDNISNAPTFGAGTWLDPVEARIVEMSTDGAGATTDGDFYIDTDDDHLYKIVSGSPVDQGAPIAGQRVIDLSDGNQVIIEWSGTAWDALPTAGDADNTMVRDDGDGKQAQYTFESSVPAWIKTADVDFGAPNTLQDAYNEGGAGQGADVAVNDGAIKLDASGSTYAPIELTDHTSYPTSDLASGQLCIKDGILCSYDATRGKWLSVQRQFLVFGRKGKTGNQYLAFGGGKIPSNNSGLRLAKDATIVSMTCQLDATGTTSMRVRKNDALANVATLTVTASLGNDDDTLNIDLDQSDFLQMYSDNAANVQDPMVMVEIAYRP